MNTIKASIRFLATADGGREKPIWSGYRAAVNFGLRDEMGLPSYNDCLLTFMDREALSPGEEAIALLTPLHPELLEGVVHPGLTIELWEGKTIGRGTVLGVS